jgi:heme A synthase
MVATAHAATTRIGTAAPVGNGQWPDEFGVSMFDPERFRPTDTVSSNEASP